mmetsp:Transcript_11765/g.33181  ORF Transcript_11765/g.33181 Transcript_11765/m.33181 type:complete len:262 (+) Transcript_11765:2556-3341(+)
MLSTAFRGSLVSCAAPNARSFVGKNIQNPNQRMVVKVSSPVDASAASAVESEGVPPAVLDGTDAGFVERFGEDTLIARAEEVFATMTGVKDDSVLAEDFRFEFPVVSLDKEAYLKAVRGFSLDQAIPDMNSNAYHFRVDPYEANRVWFTIRNSGTHTGDLKFAGKTYKGTGKVIQGAPECCSYTFNSELKVTSFTGGYVMDRRVGNTGGMGALFGILHAIGAPVPRPGSLMWNILSLVNKIRVGIAAIFAKFTPAPAEKSA